jgi:DHA1 family bicyclomycin/chloramphenicol resistance-like MFS transporter
MALVLGSLTAFGPLAIDTYLPSFPAISRDLGVEASSVQATVAVYFLGLALGQSFLWAGRRPGAASGRPCRAPALHPRLRRLRLTQSIGVLIALRFLRRWGSAQIVVARAAVDY